MCAYVADLEPACIMSQAVRIVIVMNPISQKLLGIGAVIGFTVTFLTGSPEMYDVLGLVIRSILGGIIFGVMGYFLGLLMHRFLTEKMETELQAFLLEKELKRQKRLRVAEETLSVMGGQREGEMLGPAETVDTESGPIEETAGEPSML